MNHGSSHNRFSLLRIGLALASIVAIVIGMIGLLQIYKNSKTDGFGNGWIVVKTCKEVNWEWKQYTCTGTYHSGAGMWEHENVAVRVTTREYHAGETISDVYPKGGTPIDTANEFVTGLERSSVAYNLPWIIAIGLAVVLPIATLTLALSDRGHYKRSGTAKP